jgi:hypothetical protein
MKAVIRRLHQLEGRLAPKVEARASLFLSLAILIRERRRRRCEASGEPFEEMPPPCLPLSPGGRRSIAETLRMDRLRVNQRNRNASSGPAA